MELGSEIFSRHMINCYVNIVTFVAQQLVSHPSSSDSKFKWWGVIFVVMLAKINEHIADLCLGIIQFDRVNFSHRFSGYQVPTGLKSFSLYPLG